MEKGLKKELGKKDLFRLYINEKKSLEDIARMYGVSRVAVHKYCRATGIKTRTRSQARLEAYKKSKLPHQYFAINENFFSSWSDKMAYVLGLIITDGCITPAPKGRTYSVHLAMNDKSLLEKVRKAMESEHKIVSSKQQKGLYLFNFAREQISKDLIRLGVTPRKSLTVKFPDVPDEYLRHFIRGVFDGDGSVYFESRSRNFPLRTKFVSGSKDFIYELEERLQKLGMPKRTIYKDKRGNISYSFGYGHRNSIRLFHLLYDGVDKDLYLERKYKKFVESLKYSSITQNDNMKFPEQKELREFKQLHNFHLQSDYKISDLAKRLKVSRRTIERWLSGKTKPNKEKLEAIRKYLDEKKRLSN